MLTSDFADRPAEAEGTTGKECPLL